MTDNIDYETNFYKIVQYNLRNQFTLPNNTLGLYISPNKIFTDEECDIIIKQCYLNEFYVQKTNANKYDKNNFNSNINYLLPNENTYYIYNRLRKLVTEINKEIWNFNLYDFGEPLKFIEYNEITNGSTGIHADLGNDSITKFRKLTVIIQLSNETDYEGGDLLIQNNKELMSINKTKGIVIIFPSFLLHCVKPVTKGIRNSMVTFAFGPPFC